MKYDDYCYLNPLDLKFNYYTGSVRITIFPGLVLLDPELIFRILELELDEGENNGNT